MTSVSSVPEIGMKTGDFNGRTEIALNLCMHGGNPTACCNTKETKTQVVLHHVEW
jgi:hypothetical protein